MKVIIPVGTYVYLTRMRHSQDFETNEHIWDGYITSKLVEYTERDMPDGQFSYKEDYYEFLLPSNPKRYTRLSIRKDDSKLIVQG